MTCKLAILFLLPPLALAQRSRPASGPASRPSAGRVAVERAKNLAAWRGEYLWQKELLLRSHAGGWVVIAGGQLFPRDPKRRALVPAATMREALAPAVKAFPGASHRFVFRVGESGNLGYVLGGAGARHVVGNGFLASFAEGSWTIGGGRVVVEHAGKTKTYTSNNPKGLPFIGPKVSAPLAAKTRSRRFLVATGFNGIAVVPPDTARILGLELFEIPGTIRLEGIMQSGDCRRARMRVVEAALGIDMLLPIAVWKR